MNYKPKAEVCFSPFDFPLYDSKESIVVIIDILRATSAICTALYHGIEQVIPVAGVEEARAYLDKDFLVAAERNGEVVEGFSLGNSPLSYMQDNLKGKSLVLTTTNGTQAIEAARGSYKTVIGSFLNIDLMAGWLLQQNRDVLLLCAGWKNKFNIEDTLFAGALLGRLLDSGRYTSDCDAGVAARFLAERAGSNLYDFLECSSHRKRLEKLNLEMDIRYCLSLNKAPVIPVLSGTVIIKA